MRKYNIRYHQAIHPILVYKASTQGQISTNIIYKYNKIKRCDQVVAASGRDDSSSGVAVVAS